MLEDIDFVCDVVRILMQACTDNGNSFVASESYVPIFFFFFKFISVGMKLWFMTARIMSKIVMIF